MEVFDAMINVVNDTHTYVFKDMSDPRVYHWPFLSDPLVVAAILGIYFYAVFYFLPNYMDSRKPFNLKSVIATYNIFQVIACSLLIYCVSTSGWTTYYTFGCQKVDYSRNRLAMRMAKCMWWNLLLKMTELMETGFFVLRKKYQQVSFLHVYHHVSTFIMAWICAKYVPGGMFTFTVIINSFIHVLMYGYYFFALMGIWPKALQRFKPMLTIAQMVQLCIIFIHSSQVLFPSCDVPKITAFIYLPNIAINLYFFYRFFVESYAVKKKV